MAEPRSLLSDEQRQQLLDGVKEGLDRIEKVRRILEDLHQRFGWVAGLIREPAAPGPAAPRKPARAAEEGTEHGR